MLSGACQGLRGWGNGKVFFNGYGVSVRGDEKVLMDLDGGSTALVNIHLAALDGIVKNG